MSIRLAQIQLIDADPDLECLAPVELSVVCFRYACAEMRGDDSRSNAVNKAIMEKVQSGGEVFLSGTVLRGRFALRACILHFSTTEEDIRALLDVVRRVGAQEVGC